MFKNEPSFDNGISALEKTFIKNGTNNPPSSTPIVEPNNKNLNCLISNSNPPFLLHYQPKKQ